MSDEIGRDVALFHVDSDSELLGNALWESAMNTGRFVEVAGLLLLGVSAAAGQEFVAFDDRALSQQELWSGAPLDDGSWQSAIPNPQSAMLMEAQPAWPPVADAPGSPYDSPLTTHHSPNRTCPWWRPCGPAVSFGHNWLFYQGAYGADFRPACQNHDDCLMNPWNSRYGCDRAFYEAMAAECANSANPELCLMQAQKYYVAVRLFGGFVRAGAP